MTAQTERRADWVPTDSLANRLRVLRHELGLDQREAAKMCGVGFGSWQGWELGRRPRDYRDLFKVADTLGVDRDWLLRGGPLRPEDRQTEPPDLSDHQRSHSRPDLARALAAVDDKAGDTQAIHALRKRIPVGAELAARRAPRGRMS